MALISQGLRPARAFTGLVVVRGRTSASRARADSSSALAQWLDIVSIHTWCGLGIGCAARTHNRKTGWLTQRAVMSALRERSSGFAVCSFVRWYFHDGEVQCAE